MNTEKPLLSVVSPVYKAEKILPKLVQRIENAILPITHQFEIILVVDASPDNSWQVIQEIAQKNARVKGILFSRNFGQHRAITAGLDYAQGEWIVVMDCDLQDQPEEIPRLYQKALEGYEVVLARRHNRQDNFFKRSFSKLFYKTLSFLTGIKHDPTVANFGIYHKRIIEVVKSMREHIRFFPVMIYWAGFRQTKIDVEHAPREEGKSSYSFKKLLKLAVDIILAYSEKPLTIIIRIGLSISAIAFLFGIITLVRYLLGKIIVPGYTSLIISIWFFSGLIIAVLGVVGLYVGKTFEGVKQRPLYIIQDTTYTQEKR
ncbi:MAG: glycosyltransferase family 2 protein [Bacteroidia bacterium]|nr:glycosyltransferase family 2 protein [Bacteroidia bacterium]MDW8301001.1 glycosyltransferase family 2 protein [Bacteroidia bacterium]